MKNWKTTLLGLLTAIAYALLPLLEAGTLDPKALVVAAGIAALGVVAKDAGVSGVER